MVPKKPPWAKETCDTSIHERKFSALLVAIFQSALLLNGSVVDTGAHWGGESCLFADLAPQRIVHAIEPLKANLLIMRKYKDRTNIQPLQGLLGSTNRFVQLSAMNKPKKSSMLRNTADAPIVNSTAALPSVVHVFRLDDLYMQHWRQERFAFGHFDVEGSELDLLLGSETVIMRDRPVFSVEVGMYGVTLSGLLPILKRLKYVAREVPEACGKNKDCRNIICVPVERMLLMPSEVTEGTVARGESVAHS